MPSKTCQTIESIFAVPSGIGEHNQPVTVVVDAVEVHSFPGLNVVVAPLVIAEEGRPLPLVAALGI